MKKKILLLFLFAVSSCSQLSSKVSVLDYSACELPCWNNIIPGKTSEQEALQVLQKLDRVDHKSIKTLNEPWQIYDKTIWFNLYPSSILTQTPTNGTILFIDDRVVTLSLNNDLGLTFEEMLQKVGEPNSIISIPSVESSPVIQAIKEADGVYFAFYANSDVLQPSTNIDTLALFDSAHYEDLLNSGVFSRGLSDAEGTKKIMYPWKGYGSIKELYAPRFP